MSDRPGIIYAVVNPAWPSWIKVGRAEGSRDDADGVMLRRLYQYNTGDPERGYRALIWSYAACCQTAERFAHSFLETTGPRGNGEWFRRPAETVSYFIRQAARIARLRPDARSEHYSRFISEIRDLPQQRLVEETSEETSEEETDERNT